MRWVWRLRKLVVVLGWVAAVWGVGYAANAVTQARAYVKAPVSLANSGSGWADVPVQVPGADVPGGWFAGARPTGLLVHSSAQGGPDGGLTIVAWDSTRLEQLLSRGDWLVGGLGVLVGALALAPVLGAIADGRPFQPANSRRLVVLGVTVAVAGVLAPLLPQIAGILVLHRTGLAGPRFMDLASVEPAPLLVGALILALAAAFRAGARMADDVRGLV